MDESKISSSLLPHLNEIAKRLWSGHAAIMVGAGFSKNAVPLDDSVKGFPDWNQLGEIFYEKARGREIGDERFLNPLKLADEVQASFDRPTLHKLLEDSIPNNEYEPSELHVKLLDLPWTDVFTTNYDTLLERATKSVSEYSYQTVVNTEGLVYSKSSRIVKLHGSFPDSKPFIISEEDYRRYPIDFAPFVNTVQQALLENTLVLIGFSGDDPNFLRWIGWIRDNLGQENSPNIYIVGILNLTKAQELLFLRNKIIPIDMSELDDIRPDEHYKGLDEFFEFCACKKGESDRLDWPKGNKYSPPSYNDNKMPGEKDTEKEQVEREQYEKEQAEIILEYWKEQRFQYPGWVVVPEDRRKDLWRGTKNWAGYIEKITKLSPVARLSFIFEYFWRIEKCLCPVFDDQVDAITSVLDIYLQALVNDTKFSEEMLIDMKAQEVSKSGLRDMIVFLILALLRYYREEGKLDDWHTLKNKSESIFKREEDLAGLRYEHALFGLFQFDLDSVSSAVSSWDVNETMPFWLAKKAGLLAELGKLDEAVDKLERALSTVRSKQNLKPITIDYSLVSQEAYILVLLNYVKGGKAWSEKNYDERSDFSERWNELKQYKCDPWNELKLLELPLTVEPKINTDITVRKEFDIGRATRIRHLGGGSEDALDAFRMLKFYEDIGVPHRIPGSTFSKGIINGIFERLYEYVPYWVLATMLRAGSREAVQYVFDRRAMDSMILSEVESLSANYISIFKRFSFKSDGIKFHQEKSLKQLMPEVLSRLCSKSSVKTQMALFDLLLAIYLSEGGRDLEGVSNLVRRLMATISESDLLEYMPVLLKFPVLNNDDFITNRNLPNPFEFLGHIEERFLKVKPDWSLDDQKVLDLITNVTNEKNGKRTRCVRIIMELMRLKLLTDEQIRLFSISLWSELDESGFPARTNYYKFVFCDALVPEGVDGKKMIKKYLLETDISTQIQKAGSGIKLGGGDVPLCHEMVGASVFLDWDLNETHLVFQKLLKWWDADKGYLEYKKDSEIQGEFQLRFKRLGLALIAVAPKQFDNSRQEDVASLRRLVAEMKGWGLPVCRIQSVFIHIIPEWKQDLIDIITSDFLHTDDMFISDAVEAVHGLLGQPESYVGIEVVKSVLGLFTTTLQYRDNARLEYALWSGVRVLENQESYFDGEFESAVLFALDKLILETTKNATVFDFSDALAFRKISARLAFKVFCFYEKNKKEVPDVVLRWKAVCESKDEFLEIRNKWVF